MRVEKGKREHVMININIKKKGGDELEFHLDADLTDELICHAVLQQLGLVDHLEGEDKVGGLLAGEVDLAKHSTAQHLANVKVVQ